MCIRDRYYVDILHSICITFLSFPAPAVNCIYQYETNILPILLDPPKNVFWSLENVYSVCNTVILPVLLLLLLLFAMPIYRPKSKNIVCLSFFKFLSSSLAKYEIMPFHIIFRTKLKQKSAIIYYFVSKEI